MIIILIVSIVSGLIYYVDETDEKLKFKNVSSGTSDIDIFFPQNHFKQILFFLFFLF